MNEWNNRNVMREQIAGINHICGRSEMTEAYVKGGKGRLCIEILNPISPNSLSRLHQGKRDKLMQIHN